MICPYHHYWIGLCGPGVGACLADFGREVTCVDANQAKIDA
jgi:UDP-glucose 6-dehydrogenase